MSASCLALCETVPPTRTHRFVGQGVRRLFSWDSLGFRSERRRDRQIVSGVERALEGASAGDLLVAGSPEGLRHCDVLTVAVTSDLSRAACNEPFGSVANELAG